RRARAPLGGRRVAPWGPRARRRAASRRARAPLGGRRVAPWGPRARRRAASRRARAPLGGRRVAPWGPRARRRAASRRARARLGGPMTPDLMLQGTKRHDAMREREAAKASMSGGRVASYSRHVRAGELDVTHGAILYLDDITVSFDGFKALNELSLSITAGEL